MPGARQFEETEIDITNTKARAQLALEAGRMGSWTWDVAKDVIDGDRVTATLFGLGSEAKQWPRAAIFRDIHPADIPRVQEAMAAAMSHEDIYQAEFRRVVKSETSEDTTTLWVRTRARVMLRDDNGRALRFIGVSWDVTEEKEIDQAIREIAGDMDHRAKNAFAVIRAMINIGRRESSDIGNFANTLCGQVEAMASAHSLAAEISRSTQTPHAPVPILGLIERSLRPWTLKSDAEKARISITGGQGPTVKSEAATSMAMVIQELSSKSEKFGAFGPLGGTLSITVSNSGTTETLITWKETFEVLAHPDLNKSADVFGSTLLTHSIATLQGKILRDLTPGELSIELRIPT